MNFQYEKTLRGRMVRWFIFGVAIFRFSVLLYCKYMSTSFDFRSKVVPALRHRVMFFQNIKFCANAGLISLRIFGFWNGI